MITEQKDVEVEMMAEGKLGSDRKDVSFGRLLLRFSAIYWRSFVVVLCPIILSPIIIFTDDTSYRCLYTVIIMAVFWMTEALPLAITAFIPVILFPLLGIMSTADTTGYYMNDTTMMFVASLFIATALEISGLHLRVAYLIINTVGCSHRRLTFGIFLVTMFLSLWITNTATTAMVTPIVETVLVELEAQGLSPMFVEDKENPEMGDDGKPVKKPTKITMTYFLIAAYASVIGGTGTIVGTGTNLTFKGIYEARFPDSPGFTFYDWLCYGFPAMVICGLLTWVWLQVMYMGMFRPNSADAKATEIGEEGEKCAAELVAQKLRELGPMTWYEGCVAFLFLIAIFLWFFRNPGFVTGWPSYITEMSVKDSTPAMFVCILMFIIPSKLDFLNAFSKDPSKRPEYPSPALLNWPILHKKMHWGFLFVIGGGLVLSGAIASSGLSTILGDSLSSLGSLHPVVTMFVVLFAIEMITELTASVAVANIILPVVAELAVSIRLHPLYLMLPAAICCSFTFHLPVGTAANAIVCAAGRIKTKDFMIAGIGPSLITLIVTIILFPTWGNYIYGLDDFPSWAES